MDTHAVIVADTDGRITQTRHLTRSGCVTCREEWNHAAETLFGHAAEDALGRSLNLIVPAHLRDAHWAGFTRAMQHPRIKDLAADLPVLCADGVVRSFAGRLLVLSDGLGTAIGAMAIYTGHGSTGVHPFG